MYDLDEIRAYVRRHVDERKAKLLVRLDGLIAEVAECERELMEHEGDEAVRTVARLASLNMAGFIETLGA